MTEIVVDLPASRRRRARMARYVDKHLLSEGEFLCPSFKECKQSLRPGDIFREGIMSHIGSRYDLTIDGRSLRIMVVGQESGWSKDKRFARRVPMDTRSAAQRRSALERRYYSEDEFPGRNPHMRGTTSLLRLVFGRGLGRDWDQEWVTPVRGQPFHLFEGYALVNRLLCSASPPMSSKGTASRTMMTNCLEHFEAALRILEPTLVVLQGRRVAASVAASLPVVRARGDFLYETGFAGNRIVVCSFTHPSSHGSQRWGDSLEAPYLTEVLVPTVRKAVRLLG